MKEKFLIMTLTLALSLSMVGCAGSSDSATSNEEEEMEESNIKETDEKIQESSISKDSIKVDEIDWNIEEGVIDGNRRVTFYYTNNSPYTIAEVQLEFAQKGELSEEEEAVLNNYIANSTYYDEDDKDTIYMTARCTDIVEPGEVSATTACYVNNSIVYADSMDLYKAMEPDMMTISFLTGNDTMYAIYYDYRTGSYGESSKGEVPAKSWSDSKAASLITEPEAPIITVSLDLDNDFSFNAYGVSLADFNEYIDQCKDAGFSDVDFSYETSFYASSENGDAIQLTYNASESSMWCNVTVNEDSAQETEE